MPRELWGELITDETTDDGDKLIAVAAKRAKLQEMQRPLGGNKCVTMKVKNPLVTQTIEVMKQTEMLQSLIDTYSNKSGSSNYLLNPCQMIPEVNFPPENAADFIGNDKFSKPIWFCSPQDTNFARGLPRRYPQQINSDACRASLRKVVCGHLRMSGFTDTSESALVLFGDAIDEFVRNLMKQLREVHGNDPLRETHNEVEVLSLEKAYYSLTHSSLAQVHNYFKHNIVSRNRFEIAEFNGVLQDYDKLMKESRSMQKEEFHEGDFLNILEMSQSNEATEMVSATVDASIEIKEGMTGVSDSAMMSMLDTQTQMQQLGSFKDFYNASKIIMGSSESDNNKQTEPVEYHPE